MQLSIHVVVDGCILVYGDGTTCCHISHSSCTRSSSINKQSWHCSKKLPQGIATSKPPLIRSFFMSPTHLFHLQIGEERTPDLDNIHCAILYMSIKSSWLEISENCWSIDWLPVGISPTQKWKYWEVFPILIGQTRPALDSSLHTQHRLFCSFHSYLQNTKR